MENTAYASSKLDLHNVEVSDQVPTSLAIFIVPREAQPCTVVDTLREKPYEVVAITNPETVDIVEEESERMFVLRV